MEDFIGELTFVIAMLIIIVVLAIPGAWYAHIFWHAIMIGWGS